MRQGPTTRNLMLRETLLALLVLALVFLNFGHQNFALAGGGSFVAAEMSFCGDPIQSNDAGHAPCHACRIGAGADLPPVPCAVEPAIFATTAIVHARITAAVEVAPLRLAASPRAPPAV